MTTPNTAEFPSIRARVDDAALEKMSRMFSAALSDIFVELLQNARRAGAFRVNVTVEQQW